MKLFNFIKSGLLATLLSQPVIAQAAPKGLQFKENLYGSYMVNESIKNWSGHFTVKIEDIDKFSYHPKHSSKLTGLIKIEGKTYPVEGVLEIMRPNLELDEAEGHYLTYKFISTDNNRCIRFVGSKHIKNDMYIDLISDATNVKGELSISNQCETLANLKSSANLQFKWWDQYETASFALSFKSINTWWGLDELNVYYKFLNVFFSGIWHEFIAL